MPTSPALLAAQHVSAQIYGTHGLLVNYTRRLPGTYNPATSTLSSTDGGTVEVAAVDESISAQSFAAQIAQALNPNVETYQKQISVNAADLVRSGVVFVPAVGDAIEIPATSIRDAANTYAGFTVAKIDVRSVAGSAVSYLLYLR